MDKLVDKYFQTGIIRDKDYEYPSFGDYGGYKGYLRQLLEESLKRNVDATPVIDAILSDEEVLDEIIRRVINSIGNYKRLDYIIYIFSSKLFEKYKYKYNVIVRFLDSLVVKSSDKINILRKTKDIDIIELLGWTPGVASCSVVRLLFEAYEGKINISEILASNKVSNYIKDRINEIVLNQI